MDFGFPFTQMHWHYFIAVGVCVMINLLIMINGQLHHTQKWTYLLLPIIFSLIVYAGYGFIVGWI